jgi:adenine-specific DNA-methyltransferase
MAKEGNVIFKTSKKTEMLIQRVLNLATDKNNLVLDLFLGSGTTVAVAQKMGRCYTGIEMDEHTITHTLCQGLKSYRRVQIKAV